jgi:uncharacterized membrane protein
MNHHVNQGTGAARTPEDPDAQLEQRVGSVLRWGVYVSAVCLAIGLTLSLTRTGDALLAGVLMNAGLMILMATPVARVATSVIEYAREGDWTFFVCTSIVLIELGAGIVAALVFHRRL